MWLHRKYHIRGLHERQRIHNQSGWRGQGAHGEVKWVKETTVAGRELRWQPVDCRNGGWYQSREISFMKRLKHKIEGMTISLLISAFNDRYHAFKWPPFDVIFLRTSGQNSSLHTSIETVSEMKFSPNALYVETLRVILLFLSKHIANA